MKRRQEVLQLICLHVRVLLLQTLKTRKKKNIIFN